MDLAEILGFDLETEHDQEVFTNFTEANKEYFRRQFLRMQFLAGQVEPNYDYPYQQSIEIARHQAAASVYMHLMELCDSNETEAEDRAEQVEETVQPALASYMANSSAL